MAVRQKKGKITHVLSARKGGVVHVAPGITTVTLEISSADLLRALNKVPVEAHTRKLAKKKAAKAAAKATAVEVGQ
jgi:hypothetical protein